MAQKLQINNFSSSNISELTQLDQDTAVSASPVSVLVKNSQDIAVNDLVIIGTLGSETSEKKTVTAVADTTHFTVASLSFIHNRFDSVTKIYGDKVKIYRAANVDGTQPLDASFTNIATATIDTDQLY